MLVTVSAKGQVVIPASIRKKLNIKKGEKLALYVEDNRIVLVPAEEVVKRGRGLLKGAGKEILEYLLEERRRDAEREGLRIR